MSSQYMLLVLKGVSGFAGDVCPTPQHKKIVPTLNMAPKASTISIVVRLADLLGWLVKL